MTGTVHPKTAEEVKVFLLTENRLLRDTLARLLAKRAEITVVGVSGSFETAKGEILSTTGNVVLLDDCEASFIEVLLEEDPTVKVLLFGMDEDDEAFIEAVQLGISGYVLKEASASEIVSAVRAAARGEATLPPQLLMGLVKHLRKTRREKGDCAENGVTAQKSLTPRQLQLVQLVAEGLTNKEIAANLNLSQFTVKNHLRRVMRQVEAASRHDAVDALRASGQLSAR